MLDWEEGTKVAGWVGSANPIIFRDTTADDLNLDYPVVNGGNSYGYMSAYNISPTGSTGLWPVTSSNKNRNTSSSVTNYYGITRPNNNSVNWIMRAL